MSFYYASPRLEAYIAAAWVSLATDTSNADAFVWRRGMAGGGPLDNCAMPGTCTFGLKNWAAGARLQGWYSPNHANCRSGWTYGIPIRVVVAFYGTDHVRWTGKLRSVEPIPGKYREQRVRCLALDGVIDLAENDTREITPQIGQTENALIAAVVAAMPTAAQPTMSYGTSLDTYSYAFDDASSGTKGLTLIARVLNSARAFGYPKANGAFHIENRQARTTATSGYTFTDATLDSIDVPSDLGNVYNHVFTTVAPPIVDAAATTVLVVMGARMAVPALSSVTLILDYVDPTNSLKLIGGTAQVTPIVATTDYTGNSAEDGSGTDLTSSLSVVTTAWAAAVKFVITNSGTVTNYALCQLRGKGIYRDAPVDYESQSTQSYGDRVLRIDLGYQDDGEVAQSLADYIQIQYASLSDQVFGFSFNPQKSHALMLQALTMEIGMVKTVTETMTGVSAVDVVIQGIEEECLPGGILRVKYLTAPRGPTALFILDDAVFGVLDSSAARLAYA